MTCSAIENEGIEAIWKLIQSYHTLTQANRFFDKNRRNQNVDWLRSHIRQQLEAGFMSQPDISVQWQTTEQAVRDGDELPMQAAERLLRLFFSD